MKSCPSGEELRRLLAEQLSGPQLAAIQKHVDGCRSCQECLETLTRPAVDLSPFAVSEEGDVPEGDSGQPDMTLAPRKDFLDRLLAQGPSADTNEPVIAALASRGTADTAWPTVPGYEILGVLGQGGMGLVYRARDVRLNRLVALKMIAVHANSEQRARFHREAEAAARLQHPHIVQVYEVGEHEGRPYLALELVEGGSLADKLQGTPQPARPAAELVLTLAQAMHYAHQQGIVHRDLKPANILLQRKSEIRNPKSEKEASSAVSDFGFRISDFDSKIADFGLAKQLDVDRAQTRSGIILGTPTYMAPEQAAGSARAIGPAADIYALGVILYELLTGRPPFRGDTPLETLQQVVSEEPVSPSRLRPKLPRDLQTICLKCLEKEPHKRYASAAALAEDLRRILADEPIQARSVSQRERLWRWCRRNPTVASLLAALWFVLFSGLAGVTWQWRRAEANALRADEQRQQAVEHRERSETSYRLAREGLMECVTKVAENPRLKSGPLEDLRREVLHAELLFYQKFVQLRGDEPDFQAERGRALRRLGYLTEQVGTKEEAIDAYKKAIVVFTDLVRDHPDIAGYQAELAASHASLGEMYRLTGRRQEAEQAYQEALAVHRALVRDHSDVAAYRASVATDLYCLAVLYGETKRLREAEETYQQALALRKELVRDDPKSPDYKDDLARCYDGLACFYTNSGRPQDAERAYQVSQALTKSLVQDHASDVRYKVSLGFSCNNLGTLYYSTNRYQQAEAVEREALAIRKELVHDHPAISDFAIELGGTQCNLGYVLASTGRLEDAVESYQEAVANLEAAAAKEPRHVTGHAFLRNSRDALGRALVRLGRHEEALQMWARALEISDGRPRQDCVIERAYALTRLGQHDRAILEAGSLAEAEDASALTLYHSARIYALAAATRDSNDPRASEYTVKTLQLLRQAFARGFQNAHALRADDSFDPIRERTEFQELLAELKVPPVRRVASAIEGEDLRIVGGSPQCRATVQDMRSFGLDIWSNDKQLLGVPAKAGEWIDLEVPVKVGGLQHFIAYLTRANDFGIVRLYLDGKPLGKPIDLFFPGSQPNVEPADLGTVDLKKGTATLRLEVIGTNDRSQGYRYAWGLDCVVLQPETAH